MPSVQPIKYIYTLIVSKFLMHGHDVIHQWKIKKSSGYISEVTLHNLHKWLQEGNTAFTDWCLRSQQIQSIMHNTNIKHTKDFDICFLPETFWSRLNYQLVVTVVMKNCEPLVSGPAFAIDRIPVHT